MRTVRCLSLVLLVCLAVMPQALMGATPGAAPAPRPVSTWFEEVSLIWQQLAAVLFSGTAAGNGAAVEKATSSAPTDGGAGMDPNG
jgi:Mg2+/citrate symporter